MGWLRDAVDEIPAGENSSTGGKYADAGGSQPSLRQIIDEIPAAPSPTPTPSVQPTYTPPTQPTPFTGQIPQQGFNLPQQASPPQGVAAPVARAPFAPGFVPGPQGFEAPLNPASLPTYSMPGAGVVAQDAGQRAGNELAGYDRTDPRWSNARQRAATAYQQVDSDEPYDARLARFSQALAADGTDPRDLLGGRPDVTAQIQDPYSNPVTSADAADQLFRLFDQRAHPERYPDLERPSLNQPQLKDQADAMLAQGVQLRAQRDARARGDVPLDEMSPAQRAAREEQQRHAYETARPPGFVPGFVHDVKAHAQNFYAQAESGVGGLVGLAGQAAGSTMPGPAGQAVKDASGALSDAIRQRANERRYNNPLENTWEDKAVQMGGNLSAKLGLAAMTGPLGGSIIFGADAAGQHIHDTLNSLDQKVRSGQMTPQQAQATASSEGLLMGVVSALTFRLYPSFGASADGIAPSLAKQAAKMWIAGASQSAIDETAQGVISHFGHGTPMPELGGIVKNALIGGTIAAVLHTIGQLADTKRDVRALGESMGLPEEALPALQKIKRVRDAVKSGAISEPEAFQRLDAELNNPQDQAAMQQIARAWAEQKYATMPDGSENLNPYGMRPGQRQIPDRMGTIADKPTTTPPPGGFKPFTQTGVEGLDLPGRAATPEAKFAEAQARFNNWLRTQGQNPNAPAPTMPERQSPSAMYGLVGQPSGPTASESFGGQTPINQPPSITNPFNEASPPNVGMEPGTPVEWSGKGGALRTGTLISHDTQTAMVERSNGERTPIDLAQLRPQGSGAATGAATPEQSSAPPSAPTDHLDSILDSRIPRADDNSPAGGNSHGGWTIQQSMQDSFTRGLESYEQWTQFNKRLTVQLGDQGPVLWERAKQRAAGESTAQPSAQPSTPPRPRPAPGPFTRAGLEKAIFATHEAAGHGYTADDESALNQAQLGGNAWVFFKKLPEEVTHFLEGNPAAKRLFRVTDDPSKAAGEDTMAQMGERYWLVADRLTAKPKKQMLAEALQTARNSQDPEAQLRAAVYDNLPPAGQKKPRQDIIDPRTKPVGTEWQTNGHTLQIVEDADGYRLLKDGDDYPVLPVDGLSAVPVDKGTLWTRPEPAVPAGDVFSSESGMVRSPELKPTKPAGGGFFSADESGASKPGSGLFGQTTFDAATGKSQGSMFDMSKPPTASEPIKGSANALDPRHTGEMFPPSKQRRMVELTPEQQATLDAAAGQMDVASGELTPEMQAHRERLLEKARQYDATKQASSMKDVTPAGYGPGEPAAESMPEPSNGIERNVLQAIKEGDERTLHRLLKGIRTRAFFENATGVKLSTNPVVAREQIDAFARMQREGGGGGSGRVHAMAASGSSGGAPSSPASSPQAPSSPSTPPALTPSGVKDALFGPDTFLGAAGEKLGSAAVGAAETYSQLRDSLAPQTRGDIARKFANALRHGMAQLDMNHTRDVEALAKASAVMDRMTKEQSIEFTDRYERGLGQGEPMLSMVGKALHDYNAGLLDEIHGLGTGKLEDAIENYLGRIWKEPGKAKQILARILGKRPLEGSKGFLKPRSYTWFTDAVKAGLEPVTWNPVDLALLKGYELRRYVMIHRLFEEMKPQGLVKYFGVNDEVPDSWVSPDDGLFRVYGKPTVTVHEAFDKGLRESLLKLAEDLGVKHIRKTALGGGTLGASYEGADRIETKFGSPDSVIAHELGHQIGHRWDLLRRMLRDDDPSIKTKSAQQAMRGTLAKEIRALVDLRHEFSPDVSQHFKDYVRQGAEKEAAIIQAWASAREKFKDVAPNLYERWVKFLRETPELRPLFDAQPSMDLGMGTGEVPHGGLLLQGKWYVPAETGPLFDSLLKPGLREKYPIVRGLLSLGNALNQANLIINGYHAVGSTINALASDVSLGITEMASGNFVQGLWAIGHAVTGSTIVKDMINGNRLLKEYNKPGSVGGVIAMLLDRYIAAGGHPRQNHAFRNDAFKEVAKMWRKAMRPGVAPKVNASLLTIANVPHLALKLVSGPIQDLLVPRLKAGAALNLVARDMLRLGPDAKLDDLREVTRRSYDSIENRYGQINYDNTFWTRAKKDLAMLTIRSVGWNLGDVREAAGAVADVGHLARRPFRKDVPVGEGHWLHDRLPFVVGLTLVVGAIGAIINKLFTGEGPKELKDYFQPRTGETDVNGHPVRFSLPTYIKDFIAFQKHPVTTAAGKIQPWITTFAQMIGNKDFYGKEIRNANDPILKQMLDEAEFFAKQFKPFSLENYDRMKQQGEPLSRRLLSFAGVQEASKSLSLTPAEQRAAEILDSNRKSGAMSQGEYDKAQLKIELSRRLRENEKEGTKALFDAIRAGKLTPAEAVNLRKRAHTKPLLSEVEHFSVPQAMSVWEEANADERKMLGPIIFKKLIHDKGLSAEDRTAFRKELVPSSARPTSRPVLQPAG